MFKPSLLLVPAQAIGLGATPPIRNLYISLLDSEDVSIYIVVSIYIWVMATVYHCVVKCPSHKLCISTKFKPITQPRTVLGRMLLK